VRARASLVGAAFAAAFMMAAASAAANPILVVDTGPGPSDPLAPDWQLSSLQWLSGEFTTTSPVTVTSVEGWIHGIKAGDVTFGLAAPGRFGPGATLFSRSTHLGIADSTWQGVDDLNWVLGPGTYWVIFGVPLDSDYFGSMPYPSSHPLVNEAFAEDGARDPGFWTRSDLNLGVRIHGDTSLATTPEPASVLLFATGLIGLFGARRRRKR